LVSIISILSFLLNVILLKLNFSTPAFFLLPTRAWEFGLGIICALIKPINFSRIIFNDLYLFFAYFLIILGFIINLNLIPQGTFVCLGAALVLLQVSKENSLIYNFSKVKLFQFIGLISFSLYLWHWPLYSLSKYIYVDELSNFYLLLILIVLLVFSTLTWRFIEQPFIKKFSIKSLNLFIFTNLFFIFLISLIVFKENGLPNRFNQDLAVKYAQSIGTYYKCKIGDIKFKNSHKVCEINRFDKNNGIVLFGDSHAQSYGWALNDTLMDRGALIFAKTGCLPFLEYNISKFCVKQARSSFNELSKENYKNIILGFGWSIKNFVNYKGDKVKGDRINIYRISIDQILKKFKDKNKNVILLSPVSYPGYDFPSIASRKIAFKNDSSFKI
tara:strand:- start:282 stop:1442 length:1161 start_codon:yes stop_codon:yes gene_type:complete